MGQIAGEFHDLSKLHDQFGGAGPALLVQPMDQVSRDFLDGQALVRGGIPIGE